MDGDVGSTAPAPDSSSCGAYFSVAASLAYRATTARMTHEDTCYLHILTHLILTLFLYHLHIPPRDVSVRIALISDCTSRTRSRRAGLQQDYSLPCVTSGDVYRGVSFQLPRNYKMDDLHNICVAVTSDRSVYGTR